MKQYYGITLSFPKYVHAVLYFCEKTSSNCFDRSKWAAYTSLSVLTICFNIPPPLLGSEMRDIPLPSDESEWRSASPELWARVRTGNCQHRPRFNEVLDSLLPCSSPAGGTVSVFGSYILLHSIVQNMWTLKQNIWLGPLHMSSCLETVSQALEKWQAAWESNVESSVSSGNPYSAAAANSAALIRLSYMWCGADFSPVRAAVFSHDAGKIAQSMEHLDIPAGQTEETLKIAAHAIDALKTRVKLGIALEGPKVGCFQSLEAYLFSVECCEYKSVRAGPVSGD